MILWQIAVQIAKNQKSWKSWKSSEEEEEEKMSLWNDFPTFSNSNAKNVSETRAVEPSSAVAEAPAAPPTNQPTNQWEIDTTMVYT